MFWPVDEEDWMSFTPGTWTTEELEGMRPRSSRGDASPLRRPPGGTPCWLAAATSVCPSVSLAHNTAGQGGPRVASPLVLLLSPGTLSVSPLWPASCSPLDPGPHSLLRAAHPMSPREKLLSVKMSLSADPRPCTRVNASPWGAYGLWTVGLGHGLSRGWS